MKNIKCLIGVAALLFSVAVTGQELKPSFEKEGELIKGTFYYEDGSISQEGTYKDGQLHGKWVSYNVDGKKTAIANYEEGQKMGKWFFWSDDKLTEVDYDQNRITEVTSYKDVRNIASNN